ncbi:carbohydrate kinase [Teratosphaeria nubilosa]|uniref:Gluconokinase n=1 Tax=Teratosphaeria nubilosa TaxID=161662 RepID=A0A6G1KWR5_9PEZI|nr:carbohydrate kinase [Teratosphaeria nubilosa]
MINTIAADHLPPTPPSESATEKHGADHIEDTMASVPSRGTEHKHIWVITGPAGCGKTSVAEFLHQTLDLPYLEGDSYHTPENIKKMAEGTPLTDADRWDWLILLREQALQTLRTTSNAGVIVTCSALKRKYRDVLRIASYRHPEILVHFVYLNATEAVLMNRVRARQNHYMKDYMVHSQFESLEAPQVDEVDILAVDASGTSKEVQQLAGNVVEEVLRRDGVES